jgi:putative copper resistance protein D
VDADLWDGAAVLVKAVLYAATLGAAGGIFFLMYSRSLLGRGDQPAIARPLRILIAAAIAASAARVLITAGSMSEHAAGMLDPQLLAMVWHGGEGSAAAIRAGGLLLAVPALARDGRAAWIAIAGAALAATSFAWVGHVHSAAPRAAPLLLGIHILAAAFWVGALAPLLILTRRREPRELGALAARFGRMAVVIVGALLAAGAAVLWICLESVSELWTSPYGRIACVKITWVAGLLALAAWNKLRLVPRIAAGDALAVRIFRRSVCAEMLVAGLIFLVTAALTTLAGPPSMS